MKPFISGRTTAGIFSFGFACLLSIFIGLSARPLPAQEGLPNAPGPAHKFRVSDAALADQLLARGARLVADYGSFKVFEGDATAAQVVAGQAGAEVADHFNVIHLNARALDTTTTTVKALRQPVGAYAGKRLHLLQFAGPVKPEWHAALESNGVQVVSYIPDNAYLIYGDAGSVGRLQTWAGAADYVQWEGAYLDDYKIHPRARATDANGNLQTPATDLFTIQLVDDAEANAATLQLIDQLKLEPIRSQSRLLGYLNVIARLPPARLADISARPEVVSIQPYFVPQKLDERQDQIVAGNLTGNQPSGPGYLAWLASKGFTQAQFNASGFSVDVSDSGIDNGTTTPGHFGLYQSGDLTQSGRVVYNRLEGTPNSGSTLLGCDGHGNLNAHIIAGYDAFSTGFPHQDSAGFFYGLGVCPFVKVGSSVVFDPNNWTYPNFTNLLSDAYNSGARICNNSWGSLGSAGAYDTESQAYDVLVRDVGGAATNRQMVVVFAAGNDGPSGQTVISPSTAKNVIAVGAAENVRSLSLSEGGNDPAGYDGGYTPDTDADSANDVESLFSSRGPTSDGRMKPDLVAPGTHITGGVAQDSPPPPPSSTGTNIPCFNASGVSALLGKGLGSSSNFFPGGQQFYTVSSGTSHSAPAVAGACALLRQYFINHTLAPPSPAMTKAYLMNSARYLTGAGANDTLWSASQGMGELNLGAALDGTSRIMRDQLTTDKFTATGQTRTFAGTIADPTKPLRVTLAWTDAPGNTTGNAFNNDLDLTVTINGNTYLGNVFEGQYSVSGGAADRENNVESVFLPAGVTGNFAVTITAANINSDGVPNEAPSLDQDFALVICNATPISGPGPLPKSYVLASENCMPANGVVDPNETVTINFELSNVGNVNTTNLVATLQATGGVTPVSGAQTYGALMAGGASVTQAVTFIASGVCGSTITPTFQLNDGSTSLGTATFSIPLGKYVTVLTQNFDSVTAPALPAGWTTSASGAESVWVTSGSKYNTRPNSAFSPDPADVGLNELVSPVITNLPASARLTFRHWYDLERGFDGGVLEIKIGAGAFTDILAAGGSFIRGGYSGTLSINYSNQLGGQQAWTGTSGGFVTTAVNLPAAAAGQNIQLRWRTATDSSVSGTGWYVDSISISALSCCIGAPVIMTDTITLTAENCVPTNNAIDPGETVTLNIGLKNVGSLNTSNLVATLLASGGISAPSSPQTYGALTTGGAAISRPFTFTASGTCGGTITATFQLQEGAANLGTIAATFPLGVITTVYGQNFDVVPAPATLPSDWTTASTNAAALWTTSTNAWDTSPNAAYSPNFTNVSLNELDSPTITLPAQPAQLTFMNSYSLEASGTIPIMGYDGGVLEIKIGTNDFADILVAGGSFLSGGYNRTNSAKYGNPLGGRQSWSGNSGGFIPTIVSLPAAASGQPIQLRWRCGTDKSQTGNWSGWYIDTVAITFGMCCSTQVAISLQPQNQATLAGRPVSLSVAASGLSPLTYQWLLNGTNIAGAATNLFSLSSAQLTNAGLYEVVINSPAGSITSSVARLSIVNQPVLLSPQIASKTNFNFILSGNTGFNYQVEGSTDFFNWTAAGLVTNATGLAPYTNTDTTNFNFRFYRARLLP